MTNLKHFFLKEMPVHYYIFFKWFKGFSTEYSSKLKQALTHSQLKPWASFPTNATQVNI